MHIPFEKLPTDLQEKVLACLQTDNFQAAKQLRDEYEQHLTSVQQQPRSQDLRTTADKRNYSDSGIQ